MALRTYADWEDAVRVARVVYDHSQARMVTKGKTVRKSKKMACLQSAISVKEHGGMSSTSESSKTPPFIRRKPRVDVKKSQPGCTHDEKRKIIQIFIATPLASTICLQLHPSTSISAVKELLQDRLGIDAEKQHLFLRNEMELCDALSLEDHCIRSDTNIELRLVAGLMGGRKKNKSAKKEKANPKPQTESPTSQSETPAKPAEEVHHEGDTGGATAREPPQTSNRETKSNPKPQSESPTSQSDTSADPAEEIHNGEATARATAKEPPQTSNRKGKSNPKPQSESPTSQSDTLANPAEERHPGEAIAGATAREPPQTSNRKGKSNPKPQSESPTSQSDTSADPAEERHHKGDTGGATAREPPQTSNSGSIDIDVDGNQNRIKVKDDQPNTNLNIGDPAKRVLPVRMLDWTVEHVRQWILDIGVTDSVADKMYEGKIDGEVLEMYTKGDLHEDYSTMTTRDMRLILYRRERWLKSEKQDPMVQERDLSYDKRDIDTPMPLTLEPKEPALIQGNGSCQPAEGSTAEEVPATTIDDIKIEGSYNRVIHVTGDPTINNYNGMKIWMDVVRALHGVQLDDDLTSRSYKIVNDVVDLFQDIIKKHDETTIASVAIGSVEFTLHVKSRKGLDSLWMDYCSGKLAQEFSEVLITDKLTTEDKSGITIRLKILRSDYEEGCKFFESLQTGEIQDPVKPLTQQPNEPALFQLHKSSQHAVRPKTPKSRENIVPNKEKTKKVATVLPQPILEATTMLQQSDKPDDHLDITDQQRFHQQPLQIYNEQHHKAKSLEPQAKHEEMSSGDGQPSIARGISEVAPTDEARLRMLLTGDEHGELDQSYYPVLVANKPATPDENETDAIARQFGFIKTIKWTTVLDFNSKSKVDGLCKLYHKDRMVSLQQPELFKDIESDEEFRNTIEFPEKTVWVFANGREDDKNIEAPKMTLHEWHKGRSKDLEASVTFFSQPSVIPKDRAVIMFLLLSEDDIDILCDTFRKLSSSFQGLQNIVCIAEDPGLYSQFVGYVKRWFSKEDIDKRSLVGLEWQEINKIMMRMNGVNQTTKNELPSTLSGQCFLSEKQKDEWNDITVVCKNECENTDMDETSPSYKQFVKRKELDFYHGEKVDWWNFAIGEKERKLRKTCGHVLKRKGFGEVLKKVRKPLDSNKSEDSLIVTVTLLHQPGAGGSTLARYVLWELHKDYRCVVVNSVTSRTVNQIMEVRHHGYEKHARRIPPVCVLIDNLDDVEVLDLIADLEEKSKYVRVDGGAVCVILHCKRNADPFKAISAKDRDPDLYIPLTQKLNQTEKKWFQQKYDELEHKEKEYQTGDYIPDNLLAFMVMKEEFNKEYITGVVSKILQDIKGKELKLIKLCALLNSYIHEADIPISCCDTFMTGKWTKGKTIHFTRHTLNWEKMVSASFKIMVVITENRTIKILHRSIAEEALRQTLRENGDQSLADVTLEFLNSELLRSSSYSRKILAKTTHNLLIRRERVGQGEDNKTEFSVLIEDICKMQGSEKAIEILKRGVEKLQDAFVAQQLARFYLIKEKDFDMARAFAVKALDMNPQNPYFWDTKGRVYKAHFDTLTEPYVLDQQPLSDDVWNEVFFLSFEAMKTFRKSYEVSREMAPTRIVYTGLYTELNVAFRLLQVIHLCVEPFRTQRDINVLRKYLLKLEMPPGVCLPAWDSESHSQVRELKNRVDEVLEIMDGKTTYYKDGSTAYIAGQKLEEMIENMRKYSVIYEKYYGEPQPIPKNRYRDTNPTSLAEYRRRLVQDLRCGSFHEIVDRAKAKERKNLEDSRDLLLQNSNDFNSFDLKNLICIYLALSSMGEMSESADRVYQEFVRPFYAMERPNCESCWPSFLMTMFLWPIKDAASERRDRCGLTEHITELKKRWDVDRNFSDEQLLLGHERVRRRQTKSQMRPRTHFFLGEGDDLRVFAHITELHATQGKLDRQDAGDDSFWKSGPVKERLVRLEGTLLNATSLLHRFHKDKDPIDIKLAVPHEKLPSQESVTFYLGFSWNGPVAYDVTLSTDKECLDDPTVQPSFHQAYPNHILPSGKSKISPSDNLSSIGRLQMRREELNKKIEELSSASLQDSEKMKQGKDKETIRRSKRQLKKLKEELQRLWQQDDIYDDGYY